MKETTEKPASLPGQVQPIVRPDCYVGTDIPPQDGDIVEWISNGERWTVCREDDLEGPSALHHWPDGGWCGVRLIHRPNAQNGGGIPHAESDCSAGGNP